MDDSRQSWRSRVLRKGVNRCYLAGND